MRLARTFYLDEFTASRTADTFGFDNDPPPDIIAGGLKPLCVKVLQPIRDGLAAPVTVTSGYRSPELNTQIGGSETSQHCLGQAADIRVQGVKAWDVAHWIEKSGIPFDQCILEYWDQERPRRAWVHVSHRERPRREVLHAVRVDGQPSYRRGLPPRGMS
jgi:hypothetical protein